VESTSEEAEAVARAKRDRQAFEPLYRAYLGPVYGYCYRRLGNAEAAEDATHQVFAQAMARLTSCRNEAFRGWLFAIAHNVTANIVRDWHPSASLEAATEFPDGGVPLDERAADVESIEKLWSALDLLTPEQRDVIVLRYSGISLLETAAILHSTEGAIKQMQHRAMLRLRSHMGLDPDGKEVSHG
jgi:RNA polymerase sigma-70 factor (ECF subfamily)